MINIKKLASLVGLRITPDQEQTRQEDFGNILGMLDTLGEVDTTDVRIRNTQVMSLGLIGADAQAMDHTLFFANMKHEVRKGQMVVKHKGRME